MTAFPIQCRCGLPQSENPHPDAGVPSRMLEVGTTYECIPCTVKSRHQWATRARAAEKERDLLAEFVEELWDGTQHNHELGWHATMSVETAHRIAAWLVETGRV